MSHAMSLFTRSIALPSGLRSFRPNQVLHRRNNKEICCSFLPCRQVSDDKDGSNGQSTKGPSSGYGRSTRRYYNNPSSGRTVSAFKEAMTHLRARLHLNQSGFVTLKEFDHVLNSYGPEDTISSREARFLLQCTGRVMPLESGALKAARADRIIEMCLAQYGMLTVDLMNALLRTYLENHFPFSPVEFLKKLSAHRIAPNEATYGLLVTRYSNMGDMKAAGQLVQMLNEENMPTSDVVFCSLVYGYAKSNDFPAAHKVIETMRTNGHKMDGSAFLALARGAVCAGNLDEFEVAVQQAHSWPTQGPLFYRMGWDLVVDLAESNQIAQLTQVLALISSPKNFESNLDLSQAALKMSMSLLASGHFEAGLTVLRSVATVFFNENCDRIYDCFDAITQRLAHVNDNEKMLDFARHLQKTVSPHIVGALADRAFRRNDHLSYGIWKRAQDVLNPKELSLQSTSHPQSLAHMVIELCQLLPESSELSRSGVSDDALRTAFHGMLTAVEENLRNENLRGYCEKILSRLANIPECTDRGILLTHVLKQDVEVNGTGRWLFAVWLEHMVADNLRSADHLLHAYFPMITENLTKSAENSSGYAKKKQNERCLLRFKELLEEIGALPDRLASIYASIIGLRIDRDNLSGALDVFRDAFNRGLASCETLGWSLKRLHKSLISGGLRVPLALLSVTQGEPKQQLAATIVAPSLVDASDTQRVGFQDVQPRLPRSSQEIPPRADTSDGFGNQSWLGEFFNGAFAMLASGDYRSILGHIDDFAGRQDRPLNLALAENAEASTAFKRLLIEIELAEGPELVKQTMDAVVGLELFELEDSYMQGLIKAFIVREQVVRAANVFVEYAKKYRKTFAETALYKRLIQENNEAILQQVYDAAVEARGMPAAYLNLSMVLTRLGRMDEAIKMFSKCGFGEDKIRPHFAGFKYWCNLFRQGHQIATLERVIEASRFSAGYNREYAYRCLIAACNEVNYIDTAARYWKRLHQEELVPSPELIAEMKHLLRRNGWSLDTLDRSMQPADNSISIATPTPTQSTVVAVCDNGVNGLSTENSLAAEGTLEVPILCGSPAAASAPSNPALLAAEMSVRRLHFSSTANGEAGSPSADLSVQAVDLSENEEEKTQFDIDSFSEKASWNVDRPMSENDCNASDTSSQELDITFAEPSTSLHVDNGLLATMQPEPMSERLKMSHDEPSCQRLPLNNNTLVAEEASEVFGAKEDKTTVMPKQTREPQREKSLGSLVALVLTRGLCGSLYVTEDRFVASRFASEN